MAWLTGSNSPIAYTVRLILKLVLVSTLVPAFILAVPIILVSFLSGLASPRLRIAVASINSLILWTIFDLILRLSFIVSVRGPGCTHSKEHLADAAPPRDQYPPRGSFLVVANHLGASDFLLVNHVNRFLFKDAKYVIKRALAWVPIFYQGCVLLDFLVLSRSFERDQSAIAEYVRSVVERRNSLWVVLFVEGHRINQERLAESNAFCISRDMQPFRHVLCPRTKGFEVMLEGFRDSHVTHVLDLTFFCTQQPPSLFETLFTGRVAEFKCDYRLVSLNEIQNGREFLIQAFRRKDEMIEGWKHS